MAANNYDRLRKDYGVDCSHDVYLRSPLNSPTTFWFVGKVGYDLNSTATLQDAVLSQKRLILDYAIHELRPQNFAGRYQTALELWLAPGDSEMDVVRNIVDLEPVKGSVNDIAVDLDRANVGFNPEIYVGDEQAKGGLRVERDENGKPTKAQFDINLSL